MSTLSVDLIEPVGSTLTFGQSGDTMTIPSGAIFTNNGTANGFASGNTHFSQWRLTTDFTGGVDPLDTNFVEVASPVGYGKLLAVAAGAAGSMTKLSGIFTFPVTGYWQISFAGKFGHLNSDGCTVKIYTTIDNSTWAQAVQAWSFGYYTDNGSGTANWLFDVTDLSLCKVKFVITTAVAGNTVRGDASVNETYATFLRLADT
jgi:hypothetical protein